MEGVKKKQQAARKTLMTLKEALDLLSDPEYQSIHKTLRDSVIQRYEYSIDTFWKFLKIYLQENQKVTLESFSPKAILRQSLTSGLINQNQYDLLINGISDRNLTSHTYNEELAEEIIARVANYYAVMNNVVSQLSS